MKGDRGRASLGHYPGRDRTVTVGDPPVGRKLRCGSQMIVAIPARESINAR